MFKRLCLIVALVVVVAAFAGCRYGASTLESIGGCPHGAHGTDGDTEFKALFRQWGRDMRGQQRFVETYFLNYDVNDPYRGDCVVGY